MGYLQFGRHGVRKIIRSRDISYDNVVVNPLLFASQGLRYKRKLQVILTTDIDKLGKAGDTVKVAPGYFRNDLMPKLLAFPNIDKFAYLLNEQRKIYQPTEEEKQDLIVVKESKEDKMKEYERAALRLAKAKLVLRRLIDVQKAKSRESKADPLELRFAVTKDDLVAEILLVVVSNILPYSQTEGIHVCPRSYVAVLKLKGMLICFCIDKKRIGSGISIWERAIPEKEFPEREVRQLCVNIAADNLHLPSPLSTLGEYEVPLRLPRSIPLPEGKQPNIKLLRELFMLDLVMSLSSQLNMGYGNAVAIAALSSQNPGTITIANALFKSNPSISSKVLTKAFQVDKSIIDYLQKQFWTDNNH
ncbi:hypothetical protein V8G54_013636 [Vigna mungo]|uniref:Large ribosomal subunit protein bL9c n=1 Tax=Vigna mungo TaxID=3915 RepID=A0AAQ3RYK9_VIGMU